MNKNGASFIAIAAALVGLTSAAQADIRVGVTTAVNPSAVGIPPQQEERVLYVGTDMLADERVITGPSGRAHLLFVDGSNLSVGPDSDVVIDKFVYDPNTKTGELAFSVTRGVFRLVGGRISKTSEVQFRTPAAVVGLRGGVTIHNVQMGQAEEHIFVFGERMTVAAGGKIKTVSKAGFEICVPLVIGGIGGGTPCDPVPATAAKIQASLSQFATKPVGPLADPAKAESGPGPRPAVATGGPSTAAAGGEPAADLSSGDLDSKAISVGRVDTGALSTLPSPPPLPSGGITVSKAVSKASEFTRTPANAAPQLGAIDVNVVPENAGLGALAGKVTFVDPDPGQTVTYSIVGGNTGNAFVINPTTGAISVANPAALNFESQPGFTLTVQATDSAGLSGTPATVTVNLSNLNEPPLFGALPPLGVNENAAAGTAAGSVGATDPDAGQTVTYGIVGGNTGNAFVINPTTGAISVANPAALNFESQPGFTLTVQATDSAGLSGIPATVTVNLSNLNEPPLFGALPPLGVNENAAAGTAVGSVGASDPDAGQTVAYSIVGGNTGNAFVINPATGAITVNNSAALNFEPNPSFTLTVQATDSAGLSGTPATVTVNLSNLNEPPLFGALPPLGVNENAAAGTAAGSVGATDPDAGQTVTYGIVGGNTGNAFVINPTTGAISVANPAALNFESQPGFTLTVQATDSAGLSGIPATVTVNLSNVNEPPLFGALPPLGVNENAAAGTAVGSVGASDPDAGQTVAYSIVGGNTGNAFVINPATGAITVNNSAALNFEPNPSFTLTVQATDSAGLSGTPATVTVNLSNLNEPPLFGALPPLGVNENAAAGTAAGSVGATDPDAGQTVTYGIVGGNTGNAFVINPTTGAISVANPAALNFESQPGFTLTVQATDSAGLSGIPATVTVNLSNVNEPPLFGALPPLGVNENAAAGTAVGSVGASDPDAGQTVTYSIVGGNTGNAFVINPTTGAITVANPAALNFESQPNVSLTVQATDSAGLSGIPATVTVNLNNVTENFAGRFLRDSPFKDFDVNTSRGERVPANNAGTRATELANGRLRVELASGTVDGPLGFPAEFPYEPMDVPFGSAFFILEPTPTRSTTLFGGDLGDGYVSRDGLFHVYIFFDNLLESVVPGFTDQGGNAFAGFFGGTPTATFPTAEFGKHDILRFNYGNIAARNAIPVPFTEIDCLIECGTRGVDYAISPLYSAYARALTAGQIADSGQPDRRAVHMQASLGIFGTGSSQMSFLVGETGNYFTEAANGTVAAAGFARGSWRLDGSSLPTRLGAGVTTAETPAGNAVFGPDANYMVLVPEVFSTVGSDIVRDQQVGIAQPFDNPGGTVPYYYADVAVGGPTTEVGTNRTTRTLEGFVGGILEGRGNAFFGTAVIETDAAANRVRADFEVDFNNKDRFFHLQFGSLTGASGGRSAFIDDNVFAARELNQTPSTNPKGNALTARLFMVTSDTVKLTKFNDGTEGGVPLCACEFMKWGWWTGEVLSSGEDVDYRIHLATWVAGVVPDLTAFRGATGTASYSGHAIGNVLNGTAKYIAAGTYTQYWNFDLRNGNAEIRNFDATRVGGPITVGGAGPGAPNNLTGGGADFANRLPSFSGTLNNATNTPGFTGSVNGSFFQSPADPVAGVGGNFGISGTNYQAAGTFAARKQ